MWKDSSVCIIAGRQKTKQHHAEWDENEILFFFSFEHITLPFYFKKSSMYSLNPFRFFSRLFLFFFLNQWNICMKEWLVWIEVSWSNYSKQNYFKPGGECTIAPAWIISPTTWWRSHRSYQSTRTREIHKKEASWRWQQACHLFPHTNETNHHPFHL